ncbi:SusC/RagA family TonB-linked outer membrane protein [Chitinophaga nivalis]|uniref:SusC/RagA family TonB-linked outer membrane protein n=1 Tax=Chitinophaga nivalis TaxID=2991709 RepID=A0ABT3IUX7_9BACT|nr:SusC/RagA family TonB-linked outer membrane protein [Chitinophaga nivalis]MCW3462520.1 SusC/RagA family TonB-linked outer membrane protein [Chitinophaga nivalis]MCW3487789.1 SusC/RagA family TonB-linked outer membrane protein [Chitinophaga nivalis]
MTKSRLLPCLFLGMLLLLVQAIATAQSKTITGKITDGNGSAIPGASVQVKGTRTGTMADAEGVFKINLPTGATTLIVTFIGYTPQEINVANKTTADVKLLQENTNLTDVVVVGYGTTRKKDVTGAIAQIKAGDFNKGITTAPDQLIQGKVSGLMVLNNSGAPGAAATVRIRGVSSVRSGNQPLYVVDGVPLDGRVARPSLNATGLGITPDANPLNFINSNDIASMDVLKDASATAIYGSRGANGVIIISTKKGTPGPTRLDVSYSVGMSNIMKKLDVLNADEYRTALKQYNLTGDGGSSSNGMNSILRTGVTQNVGVAISGGNENSRYRASFGMQDQQGIVRKSGLKKYTATLSGQNKFLDSKQLGIDYNIMAAKTIEQLAPITNDAGFTGSLVGQALQWNPTLPLNNPDGSLNILANGKPVNPLAMSEAFDDKASISYILASISPYFKFNDNWEYRMMYSVNHQTGQRRASIASFINLNDIQGLGAGLYNTAELTTELFNNTLSYNKQVSSALNLSAMVGFEYQKFSYSGVNVSAKGFPTNAVDYTDILQTPTQANTTLSSFRNPSSELQSFFGRVTLNFRDKYLVTATMRADGSSKFGSNNRYGYFPSFAGKWNISNEDFMKDGKFFSNLGLRVGYGVTGNQEFPAGAAQAQYGFTANGNASLINVPNPDLKWESSKQFNAGVDFSILDNRLSGTVDYFFKNTTNLLFSFPAIQPAPASNYWINLPGKVINSGVELSLKGEIIRSKDWNWRLGVNSTFLKNEMRNYEGPPVLTGSISGQGVSGATAQRLANGYPLNTFYLRKFEGFDDKGNSIYAEGGKLYYLSNPNPKVLLGINTEVSYKKWVLGASAHGAFGFEVYNNTANTVLPIGNLGSRNIAKSLVGNGEALTNSPAASSRYLENGNFLKLDNVTLTYNIGNVGKVLKNAAVYVTGQNLFVITRYTGFDPEVNTDKSVNGVSSFGIEYSPYPTARSVMFGILFSL